MFGGKHHYVTAIRRTDGSIDFLSFPQTQSETEHRKKIPFLRGIAAIIEASANGTKHLNFSSERYGLDPSEDETLEQEEKILRSVYVSQPRGNRRLIIFVQ